MRLWECNDHAVIRSVTFSGSESNARYRTNYRVTFVDCIFEGCEWYSSTFEECTFINCTFRSTIVSNYLIFKRCKFTGGAVELSNLYAAHYCHINGTQWLVGLPIPSGHIRVPGAEDTIAHTHCTQCGDRRSEVCDTCYFCEGCCTSCTNCGDHNCGCYTCSNCGTRTEELDCFDCERCSDCSCNCRRSPQQFKIDKTWQDGKNRLIGLEVEYNTDRDYDVPEYMYDWLEKWSGEDHSDGSCGREVVTPPLSGKYIDQALTELERVLLDNDVEADERCGVHCHVDARDITWQDMYRLLWIWHRVEPIMFILGGQKRVRNSYCAPTGKEYASALAGIDRKGEVLAVALHERGHCRLSAEGGKGEARQGIHKKHVGRYKAINIVPWLARRRRGRKTKPKSDCTIEFRLHRNCLEADRLANWAHLCAAIVSWAATASDQETQALPRSPLRALCAIAPAQRDWILQRVKHWRHAVRPKGRTIGIKEGKWIIKCAA